MYGVVDSTSKAVVENQVCQPGAYCLSEGAPVFRRTESLDGTNRLNFDSADAKPEADPKESGVSD